jgi:hypothetical protein
MPTPARSAEVHTPRALAAALLVGARDDTHRDQCLPPIRVGDLGAVEHGGVPGFIALGGLTSRPVRGSRLMTISHEASKAGSAQP